MEPDELEQLLVRTARLTEENHRMLRKMQRAERTRAFMQFAQWVIVLGSFVVLYYLIQPYLAEVRAIIESSQGLLQGSTGGSDVNTMELLMEWLGEQPAPEAGVESEAGLVLPEEDTSSVELE